MAKVLIIAPQNVGDIPTLISAEAALNLSQWATNNGHEVIQLFAIEAERFFLWMVTQIRKIDIVIYFGHGGEKQWYGNNLIFPMLSLSEAQWMAGKICYTMSCLSGMYLGPEMVKKGARTFSGNTVPMYAAFPEPEHNYMADFVHVWQEEAKALLNGKTAYDAFKLSIEGWSNLVKLYEENADAWDNEDWYIEAVIQNRDYHIFLGDKNAKIEQ